MSRADIIAALREKASDIKDFGQLPFICFGSAARNEASEHSDVRSFVDYDPERFSFVELIQLRRRLSDILGAPRISRPARASIAARPAIELRQSKCL